MDGDKSAQVIDGIRIHFENLHDPRQVRKRKHLLLDIVVMALLAVMSGADNWNDIALVAAGRKEWFEQFLELPHGIPSHDTFRRVFSLLDPKQLVACLVGWTAALAEATRGRVIGIDGKTLRRSFSKKVGLPALHLVSAWASRSGLTLGQVAVDDKSNEITAIPELLKLLDVKGCTVTIDAMGCQKEIAAQIREQKGHYVLALKGNQSGLEAEMNTLFEQGMETDFQDQKHDCYQTSETGHGRQEERACHVMEIPAGHPQRTRWKDLRTLAVVVTRRVVEGKETWESRSYISSLPPRAPALGQAIRQHWGIENSLHWVLDIAFREDDCRIRDRRGAQNLAAIRRWAISLLRRETTTKAGANGKRLKAAVDPNYLVQVLSTG